MLNVIEFNENELKFLDQTKLPFEEFYIVTDNYLRIAEAIEKLEVRGAPLIGIAAAYAVCLGYRKFPTEFKVIIKRLKKTRPTAVNLFWALERMQNVYNNIEGSDKDIIFNELKKEAINIHLEDEESCNLIAENGLKVFELNSRVLTHCNSGSLATGGIGTALGVISNAYKKGFVEFVFVDETRPLLQGSRLTAFELEKNGIPFSINIDSSAGYLMQKGVVDIVITGADRIAKNGDSANKIGTYSLAVLANYHKIPFYIAAPFSTIDMNIDSGEKIIIEERESAEINALKNVQLTKNSYLVTSPAFDVTPANLIDGIITDRGTFKYPYKFNAKN